MTNTSSSWDTRRKSLQCVTLECLQKELEFCSQAIASEAAYFAHAIQASTMASQYYQGAGVTAHLNEVGTLKADAAVAAATAWAHRAWVCDVAAAHLACDLEAATTMSNFSCRGGVAQVEVVKCIATSFFWREMYSCDVDEKEAQTHKNMIAAHLERLGLSTTHPQTVVMTAAPKATSRVDNSAALAIAAQYYQGASVTSCESRSASAQVEAAAFARDAWAARLETVKNTAADLQAEVIKHNMAANFCQGAAQSMCLFEAAAVRAQLDVLLADEKPVSISGDKSMTDLTRLASGLEIPLKSGVMNPGEKEVDLDCAGAVRGVPVSSGTSVALGLISVLDDMEMQVPALAV